MGDARYTDAKLDTFAFARHSRHAVIDGRGKAGEPAEVCLVCRRERLVCIARVLISSSLRASGRRGRGGGRVTYPRPMFVAERGWQDDPERETGRARRRTEVLVPQCERLVTERRRRRPAACNFLYLQ